MKRTFILCTIALTVLLMGGCTRQNNQGAETSSASESATAPDSAPASAQMSQATAPSDTTQNGNEEANMITEEQAREIALNHARLTADEVTFIKSGLDRDDGRLNYDVEFYTGDHKEYDYKIDPYTGEVLDTDFDAEYYPDTSGTAGNNQSTADTNTADTNTTDASTTDMKTPNGASITPEEAKQIALEKVPGTTVQDIREFKADQDNGKLQYEGKIYFDHKEYEFEIDAIDGSILEWDVETIYTRGQ